MSSSDYSGLSSLLQSIHGTYPGMMDTYILDSLLPSLLLALVARNTNIILSTSHVADLQKSIAKVLTIVFGLQTKRIKIRSPQSPHDLLVSLFLSSSPASSSSSSHKQKFSRSSISRSQSAPRPSSSHFTEGSDSTVPPPTSFRLPRHKTDPLPRDSDTMPLSLRLPQVIVISGLEHAGGPAQLALAEFLRTRRVVLESRDHIWNLPEGFFVVYVSSVSDGRERPAIHTTLLDFFALSITLSPAPVSASSSSPSPLRLSLPSSPRNKAPLLPYDRLPHPDTHDIPPLVSQYTTALLTAARHHPELDGTLLTARCTRDAETLLRASGVFFREEDERLTISQSNVRRVVPPLLAHRLRVRDGPQDQVMGLLWRGAGVRHWGDSALRAELEGRRTVKAILAEILAEV